jgi:hypothetical protein
MLQKQVNLSVAQERQARTGINRVTTPSCFSSMTNTVVRRPYPRLSGLRGNILTVLEKPTENGEKYLMLGLTELEV